MSDGKFQVVNRDQRIDEDEVALYDRQIRLWGVEAQNRMKTAAVLVVNMRGLAAEVVKNIVLAGIGSLTILDDKVIQPQDLGSNYFFREDQVGTSRVEAAAPRIQALNPRVKVLPSQDLSLLSDKDRLAKFDMVCLTDSDPATIFKVNELCRQVQTKLYAGASIGVHGYIFADLLDHEYTIQKIDSTVKAEANREPTKVSVLRKQTFVSFQHALEHSWKNSKPALKKRQLAKMTIVFEILVILRYQSLHDGQLPKSAKQAVDLAKLMKEILAESALDNNLVDQSRLQSLASTATADFAPSCAITGGILAQDILNTLGGREAPLTNFFVLDGEICSGDIFALSVVRTTS